MAVRYEWDAGKAASNLRKHGVSFAEAVTAVADPLSVFVPDVLHSVGEARFWAIGHSNADRILKVVCCERADHQVIRIISARNANAFERRKFAEGEL